MADILRLESDKMIHTKVSVLSCFISTVRNTVGNVNYDG